MRCYCCNENKPKSSFPRDGTNSRGYQGYCKECKYLKAHKRRYWLEQSVRDQHIKRRRELKLKAIEYKGGKCIDCGYNKHPAALCFHHTGLKTDSINNLIKNGFNEKVREELDKCVLLCHNCHDIRHYGSYKGERH